MIARESQAGPILDGTSSSEGLSTESDAVARPPQPRTRERRSSGERLRLCAGDAVGHYGTHRPEGVDVQPAEDRMVRVCATHRNRLLLVDTQHDRSWCQTYPTLGHIPSAWVVVSKATGDVVSAGRVEWGTNHVGLVWRADGADTLELLRLAVAKARS